MNKSIMSKPRKPSEPKKPSRVITKTITKNIMEDSYEIFASLGEIKEAARKACEANGIDYYFINEDDIEINVDTDISYGYYDEASPESTLTVTVKYSKENPDYDKQLALYEKKKVAYAGMLERYNIRLALYNRGVDVSNRVELKNG